MPVTHVLNKASPLAVAIACIAVTVRSEETYLDFESPGGWFTPACSSPGVTEPVDGDLVIRNSAPRLGRVIAMDASCEGDISLRTQVHITGAGGWVYLFARAVPGTCTTYVAALDHFGQLVIDRFDRLDAVEVLAQGNVQGPFDLHDDILLQLDVREDKAGQRLELRAWRCGEEMPREAVVAYDDTYTTGAVGLGFCNGCRGGGGSGEAVFDFLWASCTGSGEEAPLDSVPFHRGDSDADGDLNIGDAVFVLDFLFPGGGAPGCLDAADSNDSGDLDLSDPVYLLNFLFRGGPRLPAPGAGCGPDPSGDGLGCAVFSGCASSPAEPPACEEG